MRNRPIEILLCMGSVAPASSRMGGRPAEGRVRRHARHAATEPRIGRCGGRIELQQASRLAAGCDWLGCAPESGAGMNRPVQQLGFVVGAAQCLRFKRAGAPRSCHYSGALPRGPVYSTNRSGSPDRAASGCAGSSGRRW
jgi:hypothetical protein